ASTADCDLSLQKIELVFSFDIGPSFPLEKIVDNSKKHFACYAVVETNFGQPAPDVFSNLLVRVRCDNDQGPRFPAYSLVKPPVQLILQPGIFDFCPRLPFDLATETLKLINIHHRRDRAGVVQEP